MEVKFLKIKDIYINVDEIRRIKYSKSAAGVITYIIYLKDNSKEELSYPSRILSECDAYNAFISWLDSSLLRAS
jgi:hypothetical protein